MATLKAATQAVVVTQTVAAAATHKADMRSRHHREAAGAEVHIVKGATRSQGAVLEEDTPTAAEAAAVLETGIHLIPFQAAEAAVLHTEEALQHPKLQAVSYVMYMTAP